MAIDRDDTLRKAEKLLRQGRLDAAIGEYERIVEEFPSDWTTANALGDLLVRVGQTERACLEFERIAEFFYKEGFFPKAAALYKKILKIRPGHEAALAQLAEASAAQGLLVEARTHFNALAECWRRRGDLARAHQCLARMSELDSQEVRVQINAARLDVRLGRAPAALDRLRALGDTLTAKGRLDDAREVFVELLQVDPADAGTRAALVRAYLDAGNVDRGLALLAPDLIGDDESLAALRVEARLRAGNDEDTAHLASELLADGAGRAVWSRAVERLADPGQALTQLSPLIERELAEHRFDSAGRRLEAILARDPTHVPTLLRLVEIAVDGGLTDALRRARVALVEAYLARDQAAEARIIAEDLLNREPGEVAHVERLRAVLLALGEPDPDRTIRERLGRVADQMGGLEETAVAVDAGEAFVEASTADLDLEPALPPEAFPTEPFGDDRAHPEGLGEARPPRAGDVVMPAEPGYSRYELVDIDLTPEVEALALARSAALASSAPLETGLAPGPIVAEAVGLQLLSGETRQEPPSPDAGEEVGAERAALELPEAPAEPASETAAADLDTAFRNLREDRIGASPAVAAAQDIARAEAFRAAGLVEEATRLLESASEEPGVRFLAQTTLGELHRERGDLDQAIGCFERALESTSDPGATWQARYALAEALEAAGESSRALVVLLELLAEADEYKDARAWAERLAQAQGGG